METKTTNKIKTILLNPRIIVTGTISLVMISVAIAAGIALLLFPPYTNTLFPIIQIMALSATTLMAVGIIATWATGGFDEQPRQI